MQDRIYALEGVRNFRDFGGYPTRGGALVRRGKLFRAAHFAETSAADVHLLDGLGAALIVDLRRPDERVAQPSRWPGAGGPRVIASDLGEKGEAPHMAFLRRSDLGGDSVGQFMSRLYEEIPYEQRYVDLFSAFLHGALENGGPAIVHCAAGKDRTGIICALTLVALDVEEEDVFSDYELTNVAVKLESRLEEVLPLIETYVGRPIPLAAARAFLGVESRYLHAAFSAMEKRSGGVDGYLTEVLGFDADKRALLRARLLK